MIHTSDNPRGIDAIIDQVQKVIQKNITEDFAIDFDIYPRAYKNFESANVLPKVFVGSQEYDNLLFAEGNKVFFTTADTEEVSTLQVRNVDVTMYVIVNLNEIYPDATSRMDNQIETAFKSYLQNGYFHNITSIQRGLTNFISEFTLDSDHRTRLLSIDWQPYHVFKIISNLDYNDEICII